MSKKIKPSLKDYLRTGKRSVTMETSAELAPGQNDAFLNLLAPSDCEMWKSMLAAGITIESRCLDLASIKEDFNSMDKARFTCYALTENGAPLRPIRADFQIQEPMALLLKWDETGALTVYSPNA